jgi:hypothetical protein
MSAVLAALLIGMPSAEARPACCFTTDEGLYRCDFQRTAKNGSFRISARGKPTYIVEIVEPGVANGYLKLGKRSVPLPGVYRITPEEPGCWLNDSTGAKICAK